MANALYDKAREGFLKREIDWSNDTIKLVDHIAQLHRKPCLENDFEKAIYFFCPGSRTYVLVMTTGDAPEWGTV